ncbi:MAG TPA: hypothetical protein VIO12_10895 [Thermoanaerobaculia bacterium]
MRKSVLVAVALNAAVLYGGAFGPTTPLTPEPTMGTQQVPAIALTGSGVVALWRDQATHFGFAAVPPIAGDDVLDPVPYRDAAAAALENESYVIWVEDDWLYGFVMDASGHARTEPRLLWRVDSRHTTRIAVTASSDRYLVVINAWSKMIDFLVDRDGNVLNFTDLILGGGTRAVDRVAVASDGEQFLVVWDESSDQPWVTPCAITCPSADRTVHAIVVGSDGNPKPSTEITLATSAGMPDVSWSGSAFLAVWALLPNGGIAGRLIPPGNTSGASRSLTTTGDFGPRIAWDGSAFDIAVVRLDDQSLRVVRVSADGTSVSDSAGPIANADSARAFALSASDRTVIVAYESGGRIVMRRATVADNRGRAVRH